MKTIKVSKSSLLYHLKANLLKHQDVYEQAMEGYRKQLAKELKAKLKLALSGKDVSHTIETVRPVSYEKQYIAVITQLDWSLDEEIELDHQEFQQYVQDEWGWKSLFNTSVSGYICS